MEALAPIVKAEALDAARKAQNRYCGLIAPCIVGGFVACALGYFAASYIGSLVGARRRPR